MSASRITQKNISSPPYHPRKQLLATVSQKKSDRQHGTKHFRTLYNPRKHLLATISPKKTIAGKCITQAHRPPARDETFRHLVEPKKTSPCHRITQDINCWQVYHPRKQTASTGRNILAPRITQENMSSPPYHPRKQLLASVSPKKTDRQHGTKHFSTLYNPRKHLLATESPKKTIAGKCITQENRSPARDETFWHLV